MPGESPHHWPPGGQNLGSSPTPWVGPQERNRSKGSSGWALLSFSSKVISLGILVFWAESSGFPWEELPSDHSFQVRGFTECPLHPSLYQIRPHVPSWS